MGHFLFEEKTQKFNVIDGQQRLTTIVIFLSVLFAQLKSIRDLSEEEEICYEDMVKRRSAIRFWTVDYDNQLFIDYVIDQSKSEHNGLETESSRRIVSAFDFFKNHLSDKPEEYLTKMLLIVAGAACTTHPVQNESEAIQMFIFQNSRGKRPSNLEIVKAQFMHHAHLHGGAKDEVDSLIGEIKGRFEKIYKSISSIEYRINEDDVLLYTLRVHFNSLWETNSLDKINKMLADGNPLDFIKSFSRSLSTSFEHLSQFFGKHERENFAIHSLISLGGIAVALPFVIKAYRYGLSLDQIGKLCWSLESLVLRHRLIGTRANIISRINDVFEKFTESNKDISPVIDHIEWMKTTDDWWWAYWNNDRLKESIQGGINHSTAKYLLWKYEVHLEQQGKAGYSPIRFDNIISPELEHIAPTTEPESKPHGYDDYDDEFRNQYLNTLGNYLLLSKSHNCAVGNILLSQKLATYTHNEQQREVRSLVPKNGIWSKEIIQQRKNKIIGVIMIIC
ncbi:hypothetical protein Noc_0564 [Nitrosococcus oceani ATCC 19707]|uniref:DUF262 domain-containing protein n=2 Tax=Nitrosococcus oceani TaxID=1229 RepID=Q3JDL2_NITOC|nr:DUF262 domain-containing protein [Nitrosococcus oceani]ABA57084.1 hypothetical protein Noc_0564 [Nitrosococcus oceani ATCC 19707]EDZ66667.1 conserved hypothetical protein [Nitrosococcus oceani AFC27]KFI20445.1 hypothetical protein IB75_02980 [Nitrosococcus oceani C-27]